MLDDHNLISLDRAIRFNHTYVPFFNGLFYIMHMHVEFIVMSNDNMPFKIALDCGLLIKLYANMCYVSTE